MKTLLLLNLYYEKHTERRRELEACIRYNMNAGFDKIIVVVEAPDKPYLEELLKDYTNVKFELCGRRATFDDYIYFSNIEADDDTLVFLTNTDIVLLPQEIEKIKNLPWHLNISLALARWDVLSYDKDYKILNAQHLNRPDSQDIWIHKGKCKVTHAPYSFGIPGVDNCLAMRYEEAGYKVMNPSVDIKTYHMHKVTVRNYYDADGNVTFRYKPPYKLIQPHTIADIK